ncbi:Protein adenylyltransferase SelO [Pseudoalteromonas holothuriae]|uniref:Protein nucleotidyltransferase YdiU n=1 Tax=Pseudoalteromonas holothuriae TaxID=2963714 RepID=A0ABN8UQ37_9GAMM|nr:YdiU family protein [Pseudoalteromonas sp. CIP111951]CAH9065662.1 Protein adenylyltransferase SelO [Pseudoalteromonas sp. CIP111951]
MSFFDRYNQVGTHFCVSNSPKFAQATCADSFKLLLWSDNIAQKHHIPINKESANLYLSGHLSLDGIEAKALAYSGHQFGHFNPTLGDGRAHLIGSFNDRSGQAYDLQLKGSGSTPFSRAGDGLCALGPAVREFVMSQALGALNVPTTDCLAVVTTGEVVHRNSPLSGAVLCRVASSHIRVGSFQYLALQQDDEGLKTLMELAITRYFPNISEQGDARIIAFLRAVCKKQVELVVHWMRVGFIHGVMNTDNTLVGGETIDYGPCAMLEKFDFEQVFSSIDQHGRYAFGKQPNMASWNCARLAESMLTLFVAEQNHAIEQVSEVMVEFANDFNNQYQQMWSKKLGLLDWRESDSELLSQLLTILQSEHLDYTNTFAALSNSMLDKPLACFKVPQSLLSWQQRWQARIKEYQAAEVSALMCSVNPAVIPRNALMEQVIADYYQQHKSELLSQWLPLLNNPYKYQEYEQKFLAAAPDEQHYQTFCGT